MTECPPGVHSMFDPCPGNCTEPIDEYDELFDELWSMEYRITGDKPRAMKFAREFLDRHAHVLAEKIRDDSWSRRDRWGRYEEEEREAGQCHGADLIDPEVQA